MTNNIPQIHCAKCGECCRGFSKEKLVFLFPRDIELISSKLNITQKYFVSKYCDVIFLETKIKTINLHTLKYKRGECIFLESNLCLIFDFKPIQCQRAPFMFFWGGDIDYNYKCLHGVSIPDDWSSENFDKELLDSLLNQPE